MPDNTLPTPDIQPLPEPTPPPQSPPPAPEPAGEDALQALSVALARKARQRRYAL